MHSFQSYITESKVKLSLSSGVTIFDRLDQISSNHWTPSTPLELRWIFNPKNRTGYFFRSDYYLHHFMCRVLAAEFPDDFDDDTTILAGMVRRTKQSKDGFLLYIDHSYDPKGDGDYMMRGAVPNISLANATNIVKSVFGRVPDGFKVKGESFSMSFVAFTDTYMDITYANADAKARAVLVRGAQNII